MATWEDIQAAARRGGRAPAKPKPKPRPKPKAKPRSAPKPPARSAMPGDPGYGTGRDVRARAPRGSTSSRVKVDPKTKRVTQPRYRGRPSGKIAGKLDADAAAWMAQLEDDKRVRDAPQVDRTAVEASGLNFSGWDGGGSVGGFLKNLGSGAVRTLVNAPAGAQWAAQTAAWPVLEGVNAVRGGGGRRQDWGERATRETREQSKAGFRGIAQDYSHRWGPLFEGDVKTFGERFYEDPFPTILDVGGAYSAAGRAPSAAARAGAASVGRPAPRWAQRGISAPGELTPEGGRRYRPPRRITSTATAEGRKTRTGTNTIEVPRRPYSENLVTQGVQRGADRLRAKVVPKVREAAQRRVVAPGEPQTMKSRAARILTEQASFDRAQRRQTREIIFNREQRAAGIANRDAAEYDRAIRALKGSRTPQGQKRKGLSDEQLATTLHLEDVLAPRAGMTAGQVRDAAVARMQRGLNQANQRGERTTLTARQIEAVRNLPDELVDLSDSSIPAVARVQAAVNAGRKLDEISQARQVRAGVITAKTAQEAKGRTAGLLLGGQEWAPAVIKKMRDDGAPKAAIDAVRASAIQETPKLAKARARAEDAQAKMEHIQRRMPGQGSLARAFGAGRATGRGERNLEIAPGQRQGKRRQPGIPTRHKDFLLKTRGGGRAELEAKKLSSRLSGGRNDPLVPHPPKAPGETRAPGIGASEGRAYSQIARGRGRQYKLRIATQGATPSALKAASRKRDKYLAAVKRQEEKALGLTPATRPGMVRGKGVYIPKQPVDPLGGGYQGPKRRSLSGPAKVKQSTGYLTQKGGFDMNPALLSHQARRATANEVGPISNAAVDEFVGLAAYRTKTGELVSGKRALQMARSDPDRVVLISKKSLRDVMRKLDELDEGKVLEPGEVKMFYGEGKEPWLQALPEGKVTGEYVAVSKAAADVWREAPTTNPILKGTDTFLDYWKGGILALSPRWYVNSSLGIAFQYGLLTGGDIRSIVQAVRRGEMRDAVPDEVVLNTLAEDVGFKGKVNANRLQRVMTRGFEVNNRMESAWRRAAYINRSKKRLRDEGIINRRMSPAEIADAISNMPESIARQVVREVDLFMGEFRKFNKLEREVIKRVIPFYSWLRVISRLTLSLPVRSPVRAAAIATLGRAGEYGINPEDYQRPLYERGALKLPGSNIRVGTQGFSPAGALVGAAEAATKIADDPSSALGQLGEEALAWSHPVAQTGTASIFGTTPFGNPVIAPTGYAGSVRGFGGTEAINPATGGVERVRTRIPVDEALLQVLFPPASVARRALSKGKRPYDTTRTLDLLLAAAGERSSEGLFLDENKAGYRKPVGWGLGSAVGINPYREDKAKLRRKYLESQREFKRSKRRQDQRR